MDRARYQRVKEIVAVGLETPVDALVAYLDEQCDSDYELRKEVEALLGVDVNASFLEKSEFSLSADETGSLEQVGRIKIHRLLAMGGMGEVYEGEDTLLKRPVAVKIITAALRMSEERRAGFLNEAQVLSSLQHPNICQVYDFFADGDRDVLVLELIDGRTLRQVLTGNKALNVTRQSRSAALEMSREMAAALTAAHERGIIHRDFKPENVMITSDGQVKVLDFGLARNGSFPVIPGQGDTLTAPNLTTLSGTPGYMSPEQARSESATAATDVWSLGLVMVELLCGESLYPSNLAPSALIETAKNPSITLPPLPRAETQLLRRMLSPAVSERPSAREVLTQITRIQGRTKRRVFSGAAIAASVIVAFSGWKYTSDLKREREIAEAARNDAEDLVGFMLEDLHADLRALGRLDLLEAAASQALDYYGGFDSTRMQASQGKAAVGLIRIGEVLGDRGRKKEASKLLYQAVEALSDLHQREPDDDLVSYRLGLALMMLVDTLKTAGRFEEASVESERAKEIGRRLTRDLQPGKGPAGRPTPAERWLVLLRSLYMDADILVRQGLSALAVPILDEAAQFARPAVVHVPVLTINLADIEYKRCDTYSELGQPEKMLQACLAVKKLDEAVCESEPDNFEYRKAYVGDFRFVSRAYLALGRYDEAMETANAGLVIAKELVDWDPSNVNMQNEYSATLLVKGKVLKAQGKHTESQAVFRAARDIVIPLTDDREEVTYMHNAFTALALLGEFERANEMGWELTAKNFSRREFRELCNAHEQLECGVKDE